LVVARGAVVGFHTAAALHGFGVVDSDSIHVVVPIGGPFPQRPGIVVHQSGLAVAPTALVAGIPCTAPARTAIDLARALPRPRALAVLDACLYCGSCGLDELMAEVALHRGRRGFRQALALVPRADGRSQCAQESHLRLVVHDAGLVMFEPQVQVPDQYGEPLFVIDLADRRLRVAAEYDGSSHLDRRRLRHDRRRHNYLSSRHWRMRYFTDEELYRRPESIPAILRAALVDARSDPRLPR
jgi:very-short-patch-repair endonuclease